MAWCLNRSRCRGRPRPRGCTTSPSPRTTGLVPKQVPLSRPPTPSWVHDFPVTQNYAVIPETPIFYNLLVRACGESGECCPCSSLFACFLHGLWT